MKKTLTSLALLASIGVNHTQASEALFKVSNEIHQEAHQLVLTTENTKTRFKKLVELASQIDELNQWLENRADSILNYVDFQALTIVNGVLDFTFHHFKNKYENLIYTSFTQEFRIFSSKRNTFKTHLKQLHDELNGISIVKLNDLSLDENDVAKINASAKAFEEKIRNAS